MENLAINLFEYVLAVKVGKELKGIDSISTLIQRPRKMIIDSHIHYDDSKFDLPSDAFNHINEEITGTSI